MTRFLNGYGNQTLSRNIRSSSGYCSTLEVLKRRNMHLDSYTCELCILQREETLRHLFVKCNFARACWSTIGINIPTHLPMPTLVRRLKTSLGVPFYMDIIILLCWSIWKTRNEWLFQNIDPTVQGCKSKFLSEMSTMIHRAKEKHKVDIQEWLQQFQD